MIFYYIFSKGDEWVKLQGEGDTPIECSNVMWTSSDNKMLEELQSIESDYHPIYHFIKYKEYKNNLYAQINKFDRLVKYGYKFKESNLSEPSIFDMVKKDGNGKESDFEYVLKLETLTSGPSDDLIVAGIASTGELDYDGERMDMESLRANFDSYMKNPIIRFLHGKDPRNPDAIGKVIPEYTDSNGKTWKTEFTDKGPFIVARISNAPDVESIRTKIREGVLRGFSIGGRAQRIKEFDHGLGKDINRVVVKRWAETSIVDLPANKESFYTIVKGCVGDNCSYPIMKEEDYDMVNKAEKPGKTWMENCIGTIEDVEGVDDPAAVCGWLWYHGKEKGFTVQRAAIGKSEDAPNDVEKMESTEVSDIKKQIEDIQFENVDLMDQIQKMEEHNMEKEDNIVRMEVPELQEFIKMTIEEMTQEQELVEKSEDYERLLAENKDLRKKIEEIEARVKAQADALRAAPQEAMKAERTDEEEEEERSDEEEERKKRKIEVDRRVDKLETDLKELKESPLYKAVQDVDAPQEMGRHSHLGDVIRAQFGGE